MIYIMEAVTEEEPNNDGISLLSEAALAEDWDRPEEEAAWSHLQMVLPSVRVLGAFVV